MNSYLNLSGSIWINRIHMNLPESIWIFPNLSESSWIYLSLSETIYLYLSAYLSMIPPSGHQWPVPPIGMAYPICLAQVQPADFPTQHFHTILVLIVSIWSFTVAILYWLILPICIYIYIHTTPLNTILHYLMLIRYRYTIWVYLYAVHAIYNLRTMDHHYFCTCIWSGIPIYPKCKYKHTYIYIHIFYVFALYIYACVLSTRPMYRWGRDHHYFCTCKWARIPLYPLYIYTLYPYPIYTRYILCKYIYILNGSWFPARKPFSITDISSLPAPWWPLRPGSALAVEKRGSILVLECDGQIWHHWNLSAR
jgi:hypothetical protein